MRKNIFNKKIIYLILTIIIIVEVLFISHGYALDTLRIQVGSQSMQNRMNEKMTVPESIAIVNRYKNGDDRDRAFIVYRVGEMSNENLSIFIGNLHDNEIKKETMEILSKVMTNRVIRLLVKRGVAEHHPKVKEAIILLLRKNVEKVKKCYKKIILTDILSEEIPHDSEMEFVFQLILAYSLFIYN